MRAALFLVLALVLPSALSAAPPPPVNLGASGLSLGVRLWLLSGSTWSAASASGVVVSELGAAGEYVVTGLPVASGAARYHLVLFESAAPSVALAELTYGAEPGAALAWAPRIDPTSTPWVFAQGDTSGSITLRVADGLPSAVADPATTVTLSLFPLRRSAGSALLVDAPATVTAIAQQAGSGLYAATLSYALQAGDLDAAAGDYAVQFKVTFPGGGVRLLPPDASRVLRVVAPLGTP